MNILLKFQQRTTKIIFCSHCLMMLEIHTNCMRLKSWEMELRMTTLQCQMQLILNITLTICLRKYYIVFSHAVSNGFYFVNSPSETFDFVELGAGYNDCPVNIHGAFEEQQ
ncbi:hypothetical protein LINGRAHAP2_LOCUS4616 [Linum grandiflorum]